MKRHTHKDTILIAAAALARSKPYHQLTRRDVARAAGCSLGLVSYHFESMRNLYDAIVEFAVRTTILRIIGDAMTQRHALTQSLPKQTRDAAVRELTN